MLALRGFAGTAGSGRPQNWRGVVLAGRIEFVLPSGNRPISMDNLIEESEYHYIRLMTRRFFPMPTQLTACRLFAVLILGCASALCGAAEPNQRDMLLWYRQPATNWLQAMPVGNGMIGAMVFGGVPQERIALNESSFWSGRPHNYDNPEAFKYFPQIDRKSVV